MGRAALPRIEKTPDHIERQLRRIHGVGYTLYDEWEEGMEEEAGYTEEDEYDQEDDIPSWNDLD